LVLRPKPSQLQSSPVVPEQASPVKAEAVAALGQLMPAGDIRSLAAPTAGIAGTPRIAALHVKEGALIQRGEVLATFDHRQGLLADLEEINAKLRSLEQQIALQTVEVSRFQKAAEWGAAERVLVDNKREELIRMQGQRSEALASRKGLQTDLALSQLISPIDGLVLEIHSREGERPGSDGVMDVGASQKMEAKIEVYESDVARIRLGQIVRLTSENGGFKGNLNGQVIRISPQVEQRAVLSTDPTGDADARVVQVDVALDPADAKKVMRLAGLKVIARFQANS
jgi:HlyD family secretion protein